jgi:hypothetical protein
MTKFIKAMNFVILINAYKYSMIQQKRNRLEVSVDENRHQQRPCYMQKARKKGIVSMA